MNCFTRKTLVGANRVRIHLSRVKPIDLGVKPFVLLVKQKYYYILMYCFTRKTLVRANQVRIHLLGLKQKYYYVLMYCITRKVNCFTRKDKCFTRKTLDK